MAEYLIQEETLTALADVIREKVGENELLMMEQAINLISNQSAFDIDKLPEDITVIGDYVFNDCTNLALTELPAGVTSIGDRAFSGCYNLALTEIPAGVTSIGNYAFFNCTGLTTLTFRGKPETIDQYAFPQCSNLITINVPWAEGEVANAPWGATNATINYNYTGGEGA